MPIHPYMLKAVETDNINELHRLVYFIGLKLDEKDVNGQTILAIAASTGKFTAFRWLYINSLAKKVDIDKTAIIFEIISHKHIQIINWLINEKKISVSELINGLLEKSATKGYFYNTIISISNDRLTALISEIQLEIYQSRSKTSTQSPGMISRFANAINPVSYFNESPEINTNFLIVFKLLMQDEHLLLELVKWLINNKNDPTLILKLILLSGKFTVAENFLSIRSPLLTQGNQKDLILTTLLSENLDLIKWITNKLGSSLGIVDSAFLLEAMNSDNPNIINWLFVEKKLQISPTPLPAIDILQSLLIFSLRWGKFNIARYLVNEMKTSLTKNILPNFLILEAIDSGNLELLQWLIEEKKVLFDIKHTPTATFLERANKHITKDISSYLKLYLLKLEFQSGNFASIKNLYNSELEASLLKTQNVSLIALAFESDKKEVIDWLQLQHLSQLSSHGIEELVSDRVRDLELIYSKGMFNNAILYADKLLDKVPENPEIRFYKIKSLYQLDRYDEAETILKALLELSQIIDIKPQILAEVYYLLGKISLRRNSISEIQNYEQSKSYFEKVIKLSHHTLNGHAYYELGNLEITGRNRENAIQYFDNALAFINKRKLDENFIQLKINILQQKASQAIELGHKDRAERNNSQAKKNYQLALGCYKEILSYASTNEVAVTNLQELKKYTAIVDLKFDAFIDIRIEENSLKEPTHYEYSFFSQSVYVDNDNAPSGWQRICSAKQCKNNMVLDLALEGYFGAAYLHDKRKIIIIAHRGTDTLQFEDLIDDLFADKDIAINETPSQWKYAKQFYEQIKFLYPTIPIFVTGHSLGAYLAALTAWEFRKDGVKGVLFDPPGALELIQVNSGKTVNPSDIPVVTYLSYPDFANTKGHHIGDVKHIPVLLNPIDISHIKMENIFERLIHKSFEDNIIFAKYISLFIDVGSITRKKFEKLLQEKLNAPSTSFYQVFIEMYRLALMHLGRHSMQAIHDAFDARSGMPITAFIVHSWPFNANQLLQYEILYNNSPLNSLDHLNSQQAFRLKNVINYEIEKIDPNSLHISEFDKRTIAYIKAYQRTGANRLELHNETLDKAAISHNHIIVQNTHIFAVKQYLHNKILAREAGIQHEQTTPNFNTSLTQQVPLLQCGIHYLQKWLPGNKKRTLSYEEHTTLIQIQQTLNTFVEQHLQLLDSIVAICALFNEKLNWIEFVITNTRNQIKDILKSKKITDNQLNHIHCQVQKIENSLNKLFEHQNTLTAFDQEAETLQNSDKHLQVIYDSNNDTLRKDIVTAIKETKSERFFTPIQNVNQFGFKQKFWQSMHTICLPQEETMCHNPVFPPYLL